MKTMVFRLLCLLAVLTPMTAASQSNIQMAFDAIIKCKNAEITESHSILKDRDSNLKTGQDDIYEFIIPANRIDLVKNVMSAFEKDASKAYVTKKGKNNGDKSRIALNPGESPSGDSGSISIDDPGCNYIYELFPTDKSEDPDGTHRYAYGFNYKEEDGKIIGKIVVNYSTTSEYRQQVQRESQLKWLTDMGEIRRDSSDNAFQQSWFEQVMACVSGIDESMSPKSRIALAAKAYNLIKDKRKYPEVTPQDTRTFLNIFRALIQKKEFANDPILIELLRECEAGLK